MCFGMLGVGGGVDGVVGAVGGTDVAFSVGFGLGFVFAEPEPAGSTADAETLDAGSAGDVAEAGIGDPCVASVGGAAAATGGMGTGVGCAATLGGVPLPAERRAPMSP